ncbi:MAG: acyltransferase [Oscillospiraceae bacterium]|nr:acyltransferase [Oscillospiraceae bacterium]
MGKLRQSNIELLRIVAMLLIVGHHFSVHGEFDFGTTLSVNRFWIQFLSIGGKLGVNLFVLISGYFLSGQGGFRPQRLLKLHAPVYFYSILFFCIFFFCGWEYSTNQYLKSFFPILFREWWFASVYFVLFLFSPFLNRFLEQLSRREHRILLAVMAVCWSLVPTLTGRMLESNDLIWFGFLYCLAAYLRRYGGEISLRSGQAFGVAGITAGLMMSSTLLFDLIGTKISIFSTHATHFFGMEQTPQLILSVALFLAFLRLPTFSSPLVNGISATTFGIYLIHDQFFLRPFLWERLLQNAAWQDSPFLIPYSILCILGVFVLCGGIEWLRLCTVGRLQDRLAEWLGIRLRSLPDKMRRPT